MYQGPEVWEGDLHLEAHSETIISLGCLKAVTGDLILVDYPILKDLGGLSFVRGEFAILQCAQLTSLGNLSCASANVSLMDLPTLNSTGKLKTIGGYLYTALCPNLTSLGNITKAKRGLTLKRCPNLADIGNLSQAPICRIEKEIKEIPQDTLYEISLSVLKKKITYYQSLTLQQTMNAFHMREVMETPLYRNILLKKLQY